MTYPMPDILFVDDDPNVLRALARSLRRKRHEWNLAFVESGEMALQEIRNHRFDVVVTDLAMPGMSGLDLVRTLNDNSPEARCLILSGTADLQMAAEIINTVNVFRFYTKPCGTDILVEGITAALTETAVPADARPAPDEDSRNVVLDRLSTGVFVIAGKGRVVYMNQSAAETVATADGLSLGHDQVLRASSAGETNRLREACQQLDEGTGGGDMLALSIERPSMRGALKLILAPLAAPGPGSAERVMVFMTDPDKHTFPSSGMIARFFDLTPTESRLALELIRGHRTEEIAEAMGITISSARTYLKRVMAKTDTSRQVDLVRLILSTPQIIPPSGADADPG